MGLGRAKKHRPAGPHACIHAGMLWLPRDQERGSRREWVEASRFVRARMSETSESSEVVGLSNWPFRGSGPQTAQTGWDARLFLEVGRRHGRTRVLRQRHEGPLLIQKPFYPRSHDSCQLVILHPPGGIVGGDRLGIEIEVGVRAHLLVTTPGAARFYGSAGAEASQETDLHVAEGACLEWTPQETILYDASRSRISTRVDLDPGARFLGWDIFALGRPASGSGFDRGWCRQGLSLSRAGHPLWIERNEYRGGGESLTARWGLAGFTAVGTLLCSGCDKAALTAVRDRIEAQDRAQGWLAATLRDDLMVVRGLAWQTRFLLDRFAELRGSLLPEASPAARIWAT